MAGIVAKPTPELIKLQSDLIAAVEPFTVETGDSSAFVTTPDDPQIDPFLIEYVAAFVPKGSGENFNPHVTTGVAPREYLDQMLAGAIRAVHLLASWRGCLSAGPVRHGGEENQRVGIEIVPRIRAAC